MSDEELKAQIVKSVMERRYHDFLTWKKPIVKLGVGPSHPKIFDHFALEVRIAIESSREVLEGTTLADLYERFDAQGYVKPGPFEQGERMLLAHKDKIRNARPVWFAGGFCVEGREADFPHWTRMQRWSLEEAVAISIGFEPVDNLIKDADGQSCNSDVILFYKKRLALIKDNFDWEHGAYDGRQLVDKVCIWMVKVEIDIPDKLSDEIHHRFGVRAKSKAVPLAVKSDQRIDPREVNAMLRLIIGMAIKGYSYNPGAERSSIPKEIGSDLDLLGIGMDPDTVRKYLREGTVLLPDGWDVGKT